jgi:nucleotide-binding universal stress UspA family protein
MITTTERPQEFAQRQQERTTKTGPVLVATDGTESAEAALRAASVLARHASVDVVALSVVESLPLAGADYGIMIPPVDDPATRRQALSQRVREQVQQLGPSARDWTVEIREGDPAATIARAARELDTRLIVVGLGHHNLADRVFGGETALHALRRARTPVLAVPPGFNRMPRRVVVATDFSVASVTAAQKAFELVDTAEMVYLVHVAPIVDLQPEAFAAWMSMFRDSLAPAFERLKAEIGLPSSVKVETISLTGKASREILDFAASTEADLIVTGSSGAGLVERILVGSTATGILRGARCAVLAVPTGSTENRLAWPVSGERVSVERDQWAAELEAFTRRNAGRPASLEVDDPEMGAQAQEHDYPFLGTAWDRNDQRVEIMLGDFEGVGRHLTRGISGVTGIDILRDEAGRDWVLRVAHRPGQTILTLQR